MSGRFEIVDPPELTKLLASHVFKSEEYEKYGRPAIDFSCEGCRFRFEGRQLSIGKPTARTRQTMVDHVNLVRWKSGLITEFPDPALLARIYAKRGKRFKELWLYHLMDPRMPNWEPRVWQGMGVFGYEWATVVIGLDGVARHWDISRNPEAAIASVGKQTQKATRDGYRVKSLDVLGLASAPVPDFLYGLDILAQEAKTANAVAAQVTALRKIDEVLAYMPVLEELRAELHARTFSLD